MAFDHKHYMPILKAKAGEFRAIKEASPSVLAGFTPLLEIMDVAPKYIEGEEDPIPSKSDDAHVKSVADNIMKAIGPDKRFFVDGFFIEEMETLADGREPMGAVLEYLRKAKAKVVPVTGLNRYGQYNSAVEKGGGQ